RGGGLGGGGHRPEGGERLRQPARLPEGDGLVEGRGFGGGGGGEGVRQGEERQAERRADPRPAARHASGSMQSGASLPGLLTARLTGTAVKPASGAAVRRAWRRSVSSTLGSSQRSKFSGARMTGMRSWI